MGLSIVSLSTGSIKTKAYVIIFMVACVIFQTVFCFSQYASLCKQIKQVTYLAGTCSF